MFKNIRLPEDCTPVFLEWIDPLKNESLKHYAIRLAAGIDVAEPFALIGLSMGGMIVAAIAEQYQPAATILISSVPSSKDLPFYFKAAGKLRLHKLVPVKLVKSAALMKRALTTETPEDKDILRAIIRDSDSKFIYWAMDAILKWRNDGIATDYIHIHGTRDEVLPLRFTKPTHTIARGGHLMVMTRAREINAILRETLQN